MEFILFLLLIVVLLVVIPAEAFKTFIKVLFHLFMISITGGVWLIVMPVVFLVKHK